MSQVESSNSELPVSEPPSESMPANAVESLQTLVAGLTWMSESDYPFTVTQLPDRSEIPARGSAPSVEELLKLTGHDSETPVQEMSLQDFFAPAVEAQDWHEAVDRQRVQQFQMLLQWLEENLSDGKVYRFGTIEIEIHIVGKIINEVEATWLDLATKAIET
jgi:Nuclease A inhibitor-like protein